MQKNINGEKIHIFVYTGSPNSEATCIPTSAHAHSLIGMGGMKDNFELVQNPWLQAITQLNSIFSGIIKCKYGKYNPKSGGKLGPKLVKNRPKKGVFRHF